MSLLDFFHLLSLFYIMFWLVLQQVKKSACERIQRIRSQAFGEMNEKTVATVSNANDNSAYNDYK